VLLLLPPLVMFLEEGSGWLAAGAGAVAVEEVVDDVFPLPGFPDAAAEPGLLLEAVEAVVVGLEPVAEGLEGVLAPPP